MDATFWAPFLRITSVILGIITAGSVADAYYSSSTVFFLSLLSRICGWENGPLACFPPGFQQDSVPSKAAVCRARNRGRKMR